jgi:hypothetical protein
MEEQSLPFSSLIALLPFAFCLGQVYRYLPDQLSNMLWMCNVNNLLLAISLFFHINWLTRITAIWTVPGLVIWILYDVIISHIVISSFFAHVGGLCVGMYALSKIGASRQMALHAIIWHFILQLICRLVTPPELNVNVTHSVYASLNDTFNAYWKFWLTASVVVVVGMFGLQWILLKIFPEKVSMPTYAGSK